MKRVKGFTLIELLVVIAIIAMLAAILFPVFSEARARGRDTRCLSNLRQYGMAFKNYNSDWNGRFCPSAGYWPEYPNPTPWTFKTWVYTLKPYTTKVNQMALCPSGAKRWNRNGSFYSTELDAGWEWQEWGTSIYTKGHYGNNMAISGIDPDNINKWQPRIPAESEISEPSKVIYLIDARWFDVYGPGYKEWNLGAVVRHRNGANTVCCDGHAKWIPAEYLSRWPIPPDAGVRWDYR